MIQLLTSNTLRCAVAYVIELNGENRTVPISLPISNFAISVEQERRSLEWSVYTLDSESRTGQDPCYFSIAGEFQWFLFCLK